MATERKVALISGGAGDLGFASAVKMVSMGYDIALLDCKSAEEAAPRFREEFMNLIPLGRIQTAEDVAEVVGFLISPAADYLTGACIMADGGCMVGCGSASK